LPDPVGDPVAHLAVRLAALRGELSALRKRLDQAGVTGDTDLAAALAALAQTVTDTLNAAAPRGPSPVRWDRMAGDDRKRAFADLTAWVDRVLTPYQQGHGGSHPALEACWPEHPQAVQELGVLHAAWRRAWDRPRPDLPAALDWQDRWAPGVLRRLGDALRPCATGHRPPLVLHWAVCR
jgi:hypothetical protein